MATTGMSIIIASAPERDKVFAELYYNDEGWGILSQEDDALLLELYSNPKLMPMRFRVDDVIEVLQEATRKLKGDLSAKT